MIRPYILYHGNETDRDLGLDLQNLNQPILTNTHVHPEKERIISLINI